MRQAEAAGLASWFFISQAIRLLNLLRAADQCRPFEIRHNVGRPGCRFVKHGSCRYLIFSRTDIQLGWPDFIHNQGNRAELSNFNILIAQCDKSHHAIKTRFQSKV
jgi:hypothetical protein